MRWFRLAATGLAASLAASYVHAAQPEVGLGAPVLQASGAARKPSKIAIPPKAPAARFARTLEALQNAPAATTRGAADSQIYKRAERSVVLIVTEAGLGSGALISADGQILTNYHVIRDAEQVAVAFKPALNAALGKADLRRATVLKVDEVADLALLKIEQAPADVQPIPLGDTASLQVGADVHAIGHPTGETWTYTRGVVSQIRRAYAWNSGDVEHEATVVQTQTPINPGNSGGPLLDDRGRLVGVNSFSRAESEGLNFAVSVEDVKTFLARARDRAAQPSKAEACETVELDVRDWADPKGTATLLDTDCDGRGDAVFIEPKSRRQPTMLLVDESGRGEYDTVYYDEDRDHEPEYALHDTDGDGKADVRADFRKGEDEPYRWEKLAN